MILTAVLLLFAVRFNVVVDSALLIYSLVNLIWKGQSESVHFSFDLFDHFTGLILMIIIPLIVLIFKNKIKLLNQKISLVGAVTLILTFIILFSPFITNYSPDLQKDLAVTKLLPPFSKVKILHLKKETKNINEHAAEFFERKTELLKDDFGSSIIFIDSLVIGEPLVYFQSQTSIRIDVDKIEMSGSKPKVTTKTFLMGTDEFGRDIFTRIIYGTRVSLFVGLGAVMVSLLIASVLGFISAYYGKFWDMLFNRAAETLFAFPILFLIVLTLALFGNNVFSILFVLGAASWMSLFKIIHNEVIEIKKKDFFITAQLIGLSKFKLFTAEMFPVLRIPIIINCVLLFGNIILAEAALSYLGLGLGNSLPSWGAMIDAGQNYLNHAWWMITFPGLMLILTLLTINELGSSLNKLYNRSVK